mgnify:CR=1 FL=1
MSNRAPIITSSSFSRSLLTYRISLSDKKNCSQLFQGIATSLSFEIVPQKSWDAFLDQFREFCSIQDEDCIIIIDGFQKFSNIDKKSSEKLIKLMTYAIEEHYQIIDSNKKKPDKKIIHENRDVSIQIVISA